jgi:hypothetical protein
VRRCGAGGECMKVEHVGEECVRRSVWGGECVCVYVCACVCNVLWGMSASMWGRVGGHVICVYAHMCECLPTSLFRILRLY